MREIKFRAWHTREKKMRQVEALDLSNGIVSITVRDERGYLTKWYPFSIDLMQFTGIQDKNGRDVYEGDIVTYLDNTSQGLVKKITLVGDIRYLPDFWRSKWEVIGNMHETPELLKQID